MKEVDYAEMLYAKVREDKYEFITPSDVGPLVWVTRGQIVPGWIVSCNGQTYNPASRTANGFLRDMLQSVTDNWHLPLRAKYVLAAIELAEKLNAELQTQPT